MVMVGWGWAQPKKKKKLDIKSRALFPGHVTYLGLICVGGVGYTNGNNHGEQTESDCNRPTQTAKGRLHGVVSRGNAMFDDQTWAEPQGWGLTGVDWIAGYGMAAVGDTLYMCTRARPGPGIPCPIGTPSTPERT